MKRRFRTERSTASPGDVVKARSIAWVNRSISDLSEDEWRVLGLGRPRVSFILGMAWGRWEEPAGREDSAESCEIDPVSV